MCFFFLILVASEIMLLDAKHIYLFTYLANTVPQFLIILVIGPCFCSHILSACVQSPAATIISQACWIGHSVPFHLLPFSCLSDVSFAFQDPVWPVSKWLTVSALSHLRGHGRHALRWLLSCVFRQLSSLFSTLRW